VLQTEGKIEEMKKKTIILVALPLTVSLCLVLGYFEDLDSNNKRHISNSISESIQNNLYINKYELLDGSDTTIFNFHEVWVENIPTYIDDKLVGINSKRQCFLLKLNSTKKLEFENKKYGKVWVMDVDNAISGRIGQYLTFEKISFSNTIIVKLKLLKEPYNLNNDKNDTITILKFGLVVKD
jgi:hypothetical protein